MVKIAIAGATGRPSPFFPTSSSDTYNPVPPELGHSVLDALVATKKHEITLLIREARPPGLSPRSPPLTNVIQGKTLPDIPGTRAVHVNYTDATQLAQTLAGIHTVLSFAPADEDASGANRALADASVKAGVKRYAPSEWST